MEPLSRRDYNRGLEIARDLTALKAELGSIGLIKTMHALDVATKEIGWELDERSPHYSAMTPAFNQDSDK